MSGFQVQPARIPLPTRAFDLTGQQFGLLRALYPVANGQRGVLWLCECECGRFAVRLAVYLRNQEHEHQCASCWQELHRGHRVSGREALHEVYLIMWAKTKRLYSNVFDEKQSKLIRAECEEHGIPFDESVNLVGDESTEDEDRYCTFVENEAMTLDEIGQEFGITRERVRQIALHAYRKLSTHPIVQELRHGEPRREVPKPLPVDSSFEGCRCRRYDSVLADVIYCRVCWKTWKLPHRDVQKILTRNVLDRAVIFEETGP